MSWDNQKLILWALTLFALIFGISELINSIIALKNGDTVLFGGWATVMHISPWTGIMISAAFLAFATVGIVKIWKDKDKFPPL
jgi:hypothetical protein